MKGCDNAVAVVDYRYRSRVGVLFDAALSRSIQTDFAVGVITGHPTVFETSRAVFIADSVPAVIGIVINIAY